MSAGKPASGRFAHESEAESDSKEYHAKHSGQKKLEERNRQMISEGIILRTTVFQTQKEYLRISIEQAAASALHRKKKSTTTMY